eukprot:SAG31_NODE_2874_length_4971_cov_9.677750_3_plen_45_part_00
MKLHQVLEHLSRTKFSSKFSNLAGVSLVSKFNYFEVLDLHLVPT